jgi:CBS-domain-containing membrane protein
MMAIVVALDVSVIYFTRCVHPPAGSNPLVIMLSGNVSVGFLFLPVGAGFCVLLVAALVFNSGVRRKP